MSESPISDPCNGEVQNLKLILADIIELGQKIREEAATQDPFSDCPNLLQEWDELMELLIEEFKVEEK